MKQSDTDPRLALEMALKPTVPVSPWDQNKAPLWDCDCRLNHKKEYGLGRIVSNLDSLQETKASAELRLSELLSTGKDMLTEPAQPFGRLGNNQRSERRRYSDATGSLNTAGKALRDKIQDEIASVDRKLAKLTVLKAWRDDMDDLVAQFGTTSRLSFDVWYECQVDKATQRVIVGTVTTRLFEKFTGDSDRDSPPIPGRDQ